MSASFLQQPARTTDRERYKIITYTIHSISSTKRQPKIIDIVVEAYTAFMLGKLAYVTAVFISYRCGETQAYAGLYVFLLVTHFITI